MKSLGEQLRSSRESQGRSLDEISQTTRINRKFLEDLEHDIMPKLPPTYVHAFIKAFAQELGLDPAALLKTLAPPEPQQSGDDAAPEKPRAGGTLRMEPATPRPSKAFGDPQPSGRAEPDEPETRPTGKILVILLVLISLGFAASIFFIRRDRSGDKESAVTESKEKASVAPAVQANPPSAPPGSATASIPQPLPDSLSLEGVASESVWVRMVTDGVRTTEYTFPPSFRMRWKAKKNFLVSLGDGARINFTLNGKALGLPGKAKRPLKDYAISQVTLQRLQAADSKVPPDAGH